MSRMVAEPREEFRIRDTRKGEGVAARFRPLGADGPERPEPPSVPVFGTAPWGYKRAEVDAWMSWVAGLVEHGRKETLRADSAEATLRATLDQLEQLQSLETGGPWPGGNGHAHAEPNGAGSPGPLPHRIPRTTESADPAATPVTPDPAAPGPTTRGAADPGSTAGPTDAEPGPEAASTASDPGSAAEPTPAGPTAAGPGSTAGPTAAGPTAAGPTAAGPTDRRAGDRSVPDRDPDRPELARLQVVETTLHDVMGLLNRLVESGRGAERPRDA